MSKPFWSKSSKNDDDDISSTHLFWSSLPQLEFDPSVTSFKSLLDIFWAGHDPTVPAYSRHVYNILHFLHFIFSNSQAVHVGNILPRRRATASCTRVDEICTDRPEERNPNCDPTCGPFLPGRGVSLIQLRDNSQDQTKLLPPKLPPEVHPPEARYSSHINRTLSWTKTCR